MVTQSFRGLIVGALMVFGLALADLRPVLAQAPALTDVSMGELFKRACFTDAPSTNALDVAQDIFAQLGRLKTDLRNIVRVTNGDFIPDFAACGLPFGAPGLPNLNGLLGCFSGGPGIPNMQELFMNTVACVGNQASQIPPNLLPGLNFNSIFRCIDGILPEIPSVSIGTGLSNLLSVVEGIVSAAESIGGDLGKWNGIAKLMGNICGTSFGTGGSTGPIGLPSGVAFGSNSSVTGTSLKLNLKASSNTLASVIPGVGAAMAGSSGPTMAAAGEPIPAVVKATAIVRPIRGKNGIKTAVLRPAGADQFKRTVSLKGLKRGTYTIMYIVQYDNGAVTEFSGGTFANTAGR